MEPRSSLDIPPASQLLSAIVPVFNQEHFIREALCSILAQDYSPIEILVVNDGSTDGSGRIVSEFSQVTCIDQENRGPAAARNTALKRARGRWVSFLDADDVWPGNHLRALVPPLAGHPHIDGIFGKIECFGEGSDPHGFRQEAAYGPQLGSAVFRRSAFDRIGLFREELGLSEDQDWLLRAREADLKFKTIEETTLYHRKHSQSLTRTGSRGYNLPEVLRASLQRRRQQKEGRARELEAIFGDPIRETTVE